MNEALKMVSSSRNNCFYTIYCTTEADRKYAKLIFTLPANLDALILVSIFVMEGGHLGEHPSFLYIMYLDTGSLAKTRARESRNFVIDIIFSLEEDIPYSDPISSAIKFDLVW